MGQKSPDTPGSPEGNTEGPGTASSEPLLPSLPASENGRPQKDRIIKAKAGKNFQVPNSIFVLTSPFLYHACLLRQGGPTALHVARTAGQHSILVHVDEPGMLREVHG